MSLAFVVVSLDAEVVVLLMPWWSVGVVALVEDVVVDVEFCVEAFGATCRTGWGVHLRCKIV